MPENLRLKINGATVSFDNSGPFVRFDYFSDDAGWFHSNVVRIPLSESEHGRYKFEVVISSFSEEEGEGTHLLIEDEGEAELGVKRNRVIFSAKLEVPNEKILKTWNDVIEKAKREYRKIISADVAPVFEHPNKQ